VKRRPRYEPKILDEPGESSAVAASCGMVHLSESLLEHLRRLLGIVSGGP
jgi:hypothetical protein